MKLTCSPGIGCRRSRSFSLSFASFFMISFPTSRVALLSPPHHFWLKCKFIYWGLHEESSLFIWTRVSALSDPLKAPALTCLITLALHFSSLKELEMCVYCRLLSGGWSPFWLWALFSLKWCSCSVLEILGHQHFRATLTYLQLPPPPPSAFFGCTLVWETEDRIPSPNLRRATCAWRKEST